MNARSSFLRLAALAAATLLFAGCWQDRIAWSPDGTRAAIIAEDGLRLCDADGKLTPLLAPAVYRAAWLGDSQHLVLARRRGIKDYPALAAALGPVRTKALAAKAEVVWALWQASAKGELTSGFEGDDDLGAIVIYLREHHGAALRAKIAEKEKPENDLKELETMPAVWHSLVVARAVGDRLEIGATLYEGLAEIRDVRPAPGQPAVAFVTRPELKPVPDDGPIIFVAPLDASAAPVQVANHTATNPDWTPDGRTLVYLQAASGYPAGSDLKLGALVEREVLDAAGHIQLAEKTRDLAGLIFQGDNRVRCLRDGRVLFNAAEFHLPLAGQDRPKHEQLFALDRTKEAPTLTPLIRADQLELVANMLTHFAVSPDEKQVLFEAGASVDMLTLASGLVERMKLEIYNDTQKSPPLPAWRGPGEVTYVKLGNPRDELVLRRGTTETVLSAKWPDDVLEKLVK